MWQVEDAESLLHDDFNQVVFEPDSFLFKPVVDGLYSSKPFLPADPLDMMERGDFNRGGSSMGSVLF